MYLFQYDIYIDIYQYVICNMLNTIDYNFTLQWSPHGRIVGSSHKARSVDSSGVPAVCGRSRFLMD